MIKILQIGLYMLVIQIFVLSAGENDIIHNYSNSNLVLRPEIEGTESVKSFFSNNRPDYAVEMLYTFPLAEPVIWRDLYIKLGSISTLEEITYFSERIHKNRKMFSRAYLIESVRRNRRIPDNGYGSEFKDYSVFAYLEEIVLGKGIYKIDYSIKETSMSITIRNVSNLSRLIKIVDRDNFYIKFVFYQQDNQLNAYLFGAYTLENKFIIDKVLKYPYSTLAKRVYTIFVKLMDGFHGINLEKDFPEYLRES